MNTPQCRLCSSTNSLLSIFSGKSKLYRKYIQSLTSYTVGIKFEKHDLQKYICLTCVVQVYNFYVFKLSSLENEKGLKATLCQNLEETLQEDINDDKLPILDELKQQFVPWLLSKHSSNTEENENKSKLTFVQTDLSLLNMVNKYSQCDIPVPHHNNEMTDKDTQTFYEYSLQKIDIFCQTNLSIPTSQESFATTRAIVETNDNFSQTNCVQCKDIAVQARSRGRKRKNGSITNSLVQNNISNGDILPKRRKSDIAGSAKNGLKEYSLVDVVELMDVPPKIHFVEDAKKLTHVSNIHMSLGVKEEKPKLKSQENRTVKDEVIQSENIDQKTNTNTEVKITIDKKTDSPFSKTLCIDLPCEKYLKKSSDSLPEKDQVSTTEVVQESEDRNYFDNTIASKTLFNDQHSQNYLSPRSSGLLSVKDKVEYVKVCKYCDLTLYSRNEMRTHWRKHLKCRYCQSRFTSLKKVRVHMASECEKRLIPVIRLTPLEHMNDIKEKYPVIVQVLNGNRKRSDSFA
ncbi:unnamed protein product [Callosobruchus maculatus]|uniref:ZAD domain-containing protein n=1 Tax=Callosobruchus maculatus TaxID=64391 RepID=A0A653C0X0_CALMS|nr:unnamed protein product [Callosobruchus maculatus]